MRSGYGTTGRRIPTGLLGVAALLLLAVPATAQHRAKLSQDLADQLKAPKGQTLQVIVDGDAATLRQMASRHGLRVKRQLDAGLVLEGTAEGFDAAANDSAFTHGAPDYTVWANMAVTRESTGAQALAQAGGFAGLPKLTGKGIRIAVIDSGIDITHPAVAGRVFLSKNFIGDAADAVVDGFGHGTHMADVIAGALITIPGQAAQLGGMAPGARLISLKVLKADGSGKTSDVIRALQWVLRNAKAYDIRIVNLSMGHPVFESYTDDPLCQAAQKLIDAGIVVVASAGNNGKVTVDRKMVPVYGGINVPGNLPDLITVGALNTFQTADRSDDSVATYSSKGPTAIDKVMKPDLVAPGNKVFAAMVEGSTVASTPGLGKLTGVDGSQFIQMSGASVSTGVVSGAVALMLEANPSLGPAHVKMALQLSATFLPEGQLVAGSGSLNAAGAVWMAVNGPSPKVPAVQIAGDDVVGSGVLYWTGKKSGLKDIVKGDRIVWGDRIEIGRAS